MTNATPSRLNEEQRGDLARAVRAARWVGLILPLVVLAAATVLLVVWLPRMPDPAATHWGFTGGPNGFGSAQTFVWLNACLGGAIVVLLYAVIAIGRSREGDPVWSPLHRFLAAFSAGYAVFTAAVNISSAAVQFDLSDATEASPIGGLMGLAFGIWAIVTAAAWFAQPRVSVLPRSNGPIEPLQLSATQRAVWFGRVLPSRALIWVVGAVMLLVAGSVVLVFATSTELAPRIISIATLVLVSGLIVTTSAFTVSIDSSGLEARSYLGWPVFRLPAADIAEVAATRIDPLGEYGGWGMRWVPGGRFGIVMRAGEGVVATRTDGRIFAITLDDAETAAAVLAAAAAGAAGRNGSTKNATGRGTVNGGGAA